MTASFLGVGVMDSVVGGADDAAVFARARRVGADCVEVTPTRGELRGSGRLGALQAASRATGLPVASLVLDHHNLGGIADRDPSVAVAAADDVRACIHWAAELGAAVILVPFFAGSALVDDADLDRAAAAFRELCEPATRAGVALCYEGPLPARRIRALAERVGSPSFGCYFDFANPLLHALDTATEIGELGGLIRQVHLKDVRTRKNDSHLGRGRVDLEESVRALHEVGFAGWTVLETPAAPPPVVARDVSRARVALAIDATAEPRFGAFTDDLEVSSWPALAARFGEAGLSAVQLSGLPLERLVAGSEDAGVARAAFAERGVEIAALGGYRNLVHPDAVVRRRNLDFVRSCLELAPALDTWIVATESGTLNASNDWLPDRGNWTEDTWTTLERSVEELLPAAVASGAILAIEHHVTTVVRTPTQLLRLLERFPTEHLQLVCDPYNLFSVELLPAQERLTREYLELLEDRFVLAHLKDVGVESEQTVRPRFGAGVFVQRPYLEFLRARRPDLALVVEHLDFAEVPAVLAQVRSTLSAQPYANTTRSAASGSASISS